MPADLLDVSAAARFTARFASTGPLDRSYLLDDLESHFSELVREAEPLIEQETGFRPAVPAAAKVLSRNEWANLNVDSMLTLMGPLLEKVERRMASVPTAPLLRVAYRPAIGAQLGAVLGFLSQRVLGQYDILVSHGDEVWFVGPNMVLIEKKFGFVPRDFRLWVVLHELTHRAQFEGNPWVRDHFLESINGLLGSMDVDSRALIQRLKDAFGPSEGLPLGFRLLGPEQKERFDRMQAFMSVIEGHGNFVMDRIAERVIPTQPRMKQTLRGGGATSGFIPKLIGKLLGLELKKAQYLQGEAFFERVFEVRGQEGVSTCFSGPESLPTLEEVRAPDLWLARTG